MGISECRDNASRTHTPAIRDKHWKHKCEKETLDSWGSHKGSVNVVISLWFQGCDKQTQKTSPVKLPSQTGFLFL